MNGTLKLILFLATIAALSSGLLVVESLGAWNAHYMVVGILGLAVTVIAFVYVGKKFQLP